MKILLDTQIFLWAISNDRRLSREYRDAYQEPENELYLSVASVWEMLIKSGIGRLPLPRPAAAYLDAQMQTNRIGLLTIRSRHLAELETCLRSIVIPLTG